jgi:F420-dependent oxidoreductase-like protein
MPATTNPLIRLGLQIPNFSYPGVGPDELFERVATIATTAEASGFDSVFVMDHFFQLPMLGAPDQEMFEAYTLLTAIAARTSKVRLGAMVGGMTYRNPAFLAKTVTCLDVISNGRAIWGIGAGWFEQEHDSYGFPFGSFTDRFEKLEEALQIVKSMFTQDSTTFDGKWFHVKEAMNNPKPVQPGGPPVLIGGSGERKTLRMVAQYADACNLFGDVGQIGRLIGVLGEHCERLGRDPGEICKTRLGTLVIGETTAAAEAKLTERLGGVKLSDLPSDQQEMVRSRMTIGDPDTVAEAVQQLLDAGIDGVLFNFGVANDLEAIALAGKTIRPLLA